MLNNIKLWCFEINIYGNITCFPQSYQGSQHRQENIWSFLLFSGMDKMIHILVI